MRNLLARIRCGQLCLLVQFAILALGTTKAFAFPEMIRHGYVNCTACHVSPAGGGVLTPYGRGLSAELLSTWGTESEAQFLHGAFSKKNSVPKNSNELETISSPQLIQDWLQIGGDIRSLQYHYENSQVKMGQWINMQAMIEASAHVGKWTANLAVGQLDSNDHWSGNGTQYYLMNQLNETLSVRAGRFTPQFGLNIPEHISPPRANLGFGANSERNSLELQLADEIWSLAATYSEAPLIHQNPGEKALALKIERVFSDTLKPGLSYWRGETETTQRQIVGLHALLGLSKNTFWLSEVDWQEQITKSTQITQHSPATSQKWGYEIHKGLVGLIVVDGQMGRLEDPNTRVIHYGGGLQFFPRPHFHLEALWTKEQAPQTSTGEGDYAWFLLHYYL